MENYNAKREYQTLDDPNYKHPPFSKDIGDKQPELNPPQQKPDDSTRSGSGPRHQKSIKQAWLKFSDRTSLQGLPNVGRATRWYRKLFWAIFFLVAMGVCIYQMAQLAVNYLGFSTTVVMSLDFGSQKFPAVTICNLNQLRKSQVHRTPPELQQFLTTKFSDGINYTHIDPIFMIPGSMGNDRTGYGPRRLKDKVRQEFAWLLGKMDPETRWRVGHRIENMLMACAYGGRECSAANFSHRFSREYGNCFTFNSIVHRNESLVAERWGERFGLQLILNIEDYEYLHHVTMDQGLVIRVHPFGTIPTMTDDAYAIAPGFVNRISVSQLTVKRLGGKYGECGDKIGFRKNYGFYYTREACLDTCEDRLIASMCDCYRSDYLEAYPEDLIFNDTDIPGLRPCTKTHCMCIWEVITNITNNPDLCGCVPPCKERRFDVCHSCSIWPHVDRWDNVVKYTCKHIPKGHCEELRNIPPKERIPILRQSYMAVRVFFSSLKISELNETESYEVCQFLSDFGGTVGLYVGASLFTLVELFDAILETFSILCARLWRRRAKAKGDSMDGPNESHL